MREIEGEKKNGDGDGDKKKKLGEKKKKMSDARICVIKMVEKIESVGLQKWKRRTPFSCKKKTPYIFAKSKFYFLQNNLSSYILYFGVRKVLF